MPSPVSRPCAKRPDCPGDENTPIRVKRRRSLAGSLDSSLQQSPDSPKAVSEGGRGSDDDGGGDDDDGGNDDGGSLTGSDVAPGGLAGLLSV